MNFKTTVLGLVGLGLLSVGPGCSSSEADDDADEGALTDDAISAPGQWVVDLKAAARLYGRSTKHFLGYDGEELGGAQAGFPPGTIVWDQTFRFDSEHKAVDPNTEFKAVKDESGRIYGPKGRWLNIIPVLKDTDPVKQVHLRKWMQNGDVLAFFHPEQRSMREAMDRRVSHVAMHYDYESPYNGKTFVHHVDNPNNYGPRYNYTPETHMPFHIFRYKPKGMSAEQSKAYGLAARNWAFVSDDLSPFADFFSLSLQRFDQLQAFRDAALAGREMPNLYCSGLAFAALNLGVNYPMKAAELAGKSFRRVETDETLDARVLAPAETEGLRGLNRLVFEPYTPSELATAWLDNMYSHFDVAGRQKLARSPSTQGSVAQGFAQLKFSDVEGKQSVGDRSDVTVSDPRNMKAWGEAYGLAAGAETERFIARSDIALVGSDGVAVPLGELLNKNPQIDRNQPASRLLRELEIKYIKNRFVPPRIWGDTSEDRQWYAPSADRRAEATSDMVYVGTVINCELLAAADDSGADACKVDIEGVGAGSSEFSQGGSDTATYPHYQTPNGGERTHRRFDARTGPDAIGHGSKIVVRASASDISDVRFLFHTPAMYADAANLSIYPEGKWAQMSSLVDARQYDGACTEIYKNAAQSSTRGTCAPMEGIVLDPSSLGASGPVTDQTLTFDLMRVCTVKDEQTMTCPVATQRSGKWDFAGIAMKDVSRVVPKGQTPAYVDATMVEVGAQTAGQEIAQCPACPTGGAHFNQWTVHIRNDASSGGATGGGGGNTTPPPPPGGNDKPGGR